MLRKLCQWLGKRLPHFTIPDADGNPYLTRYYLFGADRAFGNIFLHHFHKSDSDMDDDGVLLMHNHPWPWSFSIILVGGYEEERTRDIDQNVHPGNTITRKQFRAGSFNFITHKDFHRVDLLDGETWSLFFTGWRSNKRSWGFWNRRRNHYRDWTTMSKAIE
jgi:hypothetical protein